MASVVCSLGIEQVVRSSNNLMPSFNKPNSETSVHILTNINKFQNIRFQGYIIHVLGSL